MQWYYQAADTDQVRGPVDSATLKQLVETGYINQTSRVRKGADGTWLRAGQVGSLFPVVNHTPAAPARDPQVDLAPHWKLVAGAAVLILVSLTGAIAFVAGHRAGRVEDRTKFSQSEVRLAAAREQVSSLSAKIPPLAAELDATTAKLEQVTAERDERAVSLKAASRDNDALRSRLVDKEKELDATQQDVAATQGALKKIKAELSLAVATIAEIDKLDKADAERLRKTRAIASAIAEKQLKEYALLVSGENKRDFTRALSTLTEIHETVSSGKKVTSLPLWLESRASAYDGRKFMVRRILNIGGEYIPPGSDTSLQEAWDKALESLPK